MWEDSKDMIESVADDQSLLHQVIIDYSEDMSAGQGKLKKPIWYNLYLSSLIDFPWLWVNCDGKRLVRLVPGIDSKWPKTVWPPRSLIWPL